MPNTKFYNLIVSFIDSSGLEAENVALKKIWEQGGNIMVELYFYKNKSSRVVDGAFIKSVIDLSTEAEFFSAKSLLEEYIKIKQLHQKKEKYAEQLKIFLDIRDDIIILLYVGKVIDYYSEIKKQTIINYIQKKYENQMLTSQFIEGHLQMINPNKEDFYNAVKNLSKKTPEEAEDLVKEVVKICLSDGFLRYKEKICIAEILQNLREQGVEPDVGL